MVIKMAKNKTTKESESKKKPDWQTVTPIKGSCLTLKARKYLEAKIIEHCDKKALLEKECNRPLEEQMQRFDGRRCWHAAYSACCRHILKNI